MKIFVETYNLIEGFHNWPDAPERYSYLGLRHRHQFELRCKFEVKHLDREIEVNYRQWDISDFLHHKFGLPCEFGGMSCEQIAEILMNEYPDCFSCTVLEDGFGGATLTR